MHRIVPILRDWWLWYPGVGTYIAVLGFIGIAVTILRDVTKIGRREKAVWIAVATLLLLLELHSISLDRRAHDKEQNDARSRQIEQFNTIVQQAQQHFDSTINGLSTLLKNTAPRAVLTLQQSQAARFTSADITKDTVLRVWYTNIGNEEAIGTIYDGHLYVGLKNDIPTQKELSAQFDKWWKDTKSNKIKRDPIYPQTPGTFEISTPRFSDDELNGLAIGTSTVYVFIRFVYSDHDGRWTTDKCFSYVNPLKSIGSIAQTCKVHDRTRYPAGKEQ